MKSHLTGHATATVTSTLDKFGPKTRAAIAAANNTPGEKISAAWFDEYPIGPSDYYTGRDPLTIGRVAFQPSNNGWGTIHGASLPSQAAPDLLYRPNDKISLSEINRAVDTLAANRAARTVAETNTAQVGGTHYGNPATDVYAFSMANQLDPMQFNIVKYVTRFRKKNGLEDLKKARQTLDRLIAHEEAAK